MIVISRNIVLSEAEEESALNPLIGYHNLVLVSNIDSTSEDASYPVTNLANPATHLFWRAGVNTGDEYITVDVSAYLDEIDYLAVARHNFGTANVTVSVEGCLDLSESPQVWFEVIEERILADDAPVLFRFTPETLAGIRLRIQPGDDTPEASVMYVGKLLVMERSIKIDVDHTPFQMGITSKITVGRSESGHFLGRVVLNELSESQAEFAHITPDWYREKFAPFVANSRTLPFFFAWNPSEYPLEVGYAWIMGDDPRAQISTVTRRVAVQLTMQGIT